MRRPYSAYKDSTAPWFGDVPSSWDMVRLGAILRERGEKNDGTKTENVLSVLKDIGVINYEDKGDIGNKKSEDIERYKIVHEGDLVLNSMNVIIGSVGMSPEYGSLSPVYYVLKPADDSVYMPYYDYVFKIRPFQDSLKRIGYGILDHRMRIPMTLLKKEPLPKPSLEEQKAIVAYLDEQTAVINQFLTNKRRLIALLEEQKQVVINTAVTQGLDTAVSCKPSGIDWLGDIPSHWEIKKLKYIAEVQTGLTLGQKYPNISLIERPYLRVANVQDGYLDLSEITTIQLPVDKATRYELQVGDVLMTEGGDFDKLGRGYVWEGQIDNCLHQNHIFAVRPNKEILRPYFLTAIMSSLHGKEYFIEASKQTTNLASINSSKLKRFPVLLPPLKEQQHILDHLEHKTAEINTAIERTQREIELIEEYRTTLIAHAVTGKIDVRSGV